MESTTPNNNFGSPSCANYLWRSPCFCDSFSHRCFSKVRATRNCGWRPGWTIEQLDSRIDGLDSRMDGIDNRMETLEQGQQRIIELLTTGRR